MTKAETLKRDKKIIERALKGYIRRLKGPIALRKAMGYACFSGGKRLRPILAVESSKVLNGGIKKILPFACAIEFIHTFSLVHDDLPAMDDDDTRRGKPACHKKFGEGPAILAGDALLNLAFGILSGLKHEKTPEIMSLLSAAVGTENMIGGQVLDLDYEKSLKKNKVYGNKINRMKTAALMAASCATGAVMAGAGKRDLKRFHEFGINLGLAFQIADDIKDSTKMRLSAAEGMKKEIKFLISKGKKYMGPFGRKADTLNYIADSIYGKIA